MKNKLSKIGKIVAVVASCLMFASFSPSLDGRAVVVDEGVFPQGLFAKTVGYLPGDIISVASISSDSTVDLLVIGALDPSEGVAIMLSPEAAASIGIDKSANNIVKITKRSGQDERVYGNAVIAKNVNATEYSETDARKFDSTIASEKQVDFDDDNLEPEEEPAQIFEEETTENLETENLEDEAIDESEYEEEIVEESTEDEVIEEEVVENEEVSEEIEEVSDEYVEETVEDSIEETPVEESFEEEIIEEEPEEVVEDNEDYEIITAESEEEETETEAPIEETVEEPEEELQAEVVDDEVPEVIEEDEEPIEEEAVEAETLEDIQDETPVEEPEVEEDIIEETFEEEQVEEIEEETEPEEVEEEIEEVEEAEVPADDEYEAIVLVPADSNPPEELEEESLEPEDEVVEDISEEEVEIIEEEIDESEMIDDEIIAKSEGVEDVENIKDYSSTKSMPSKKVTAPSSYRKYMVNSLSELKSGAYYIQIAALSEDKGILEIVEKYASNYPVTIVPMAGGIRKQVMIGPLNMDEYAVVLERFKSYGYKDAFLRKIK